MQNTFGDQGGDKKGPGKILDMVAEEHNVHNAKQKASVQATGKKDPSKDRSCQAGRPLKA